MSEPSEADKRSRRLFVPIDTFPRSHIDFVPKGHRGTITQIGGTRNRGTVRHDYLFLRRPAPQPNPGQVVEGRSYEGGWTE